MGIIRYKPKKENIFKLKKFLNNDGKLNKNILIIEKHGNIRK
jgi:hypothetical protein